MSSPEPLILTYHSLDNAGTVLSVAPSVFRQQMEILRDTGVAVVPVSEIASRPGAVAVTFDDGYENFHAHGAAELQRTGFPATVFAVSGYAGREAGWPRAARLPLMTWAQLDEVRQAGIEIGSHTARHTDLTALTPTRAAEELEACSEDLERHLGQRPSTFAYPYGACNTQVRQLVAARFRCACGTRLAAVHAGDDVHLLPRIEMFYFRDLRRFRDLVQGRGRAYLAVRRWLREARERWC